MQWLRDVLWSTAAPRGTDNALGRAASGSPWRRPHSCTSVRILPEACGLAGPACVAQDADGKVLVSTCWRACPAVWADLQRFRPAGSSRKMPTAKSTLRGTDQGRDGLEKRGAVAMCANGARHAWCARRICARGSDVYLRNQWMDPRIDESRLDAFGACHAPRGFRCWRKP